MLPSRLQVATSYLSAHCGPRSASVFPVLDAIKENYEVYPIIDPVGGTSSEAHKLALHRMIQAGAKPVSWVQLICELQRDWQRKNTAGDFAKILFAVEGH